ncbi:unnamed protein product [Auanema sp. JU1783]|nr:unnamed protein product [Auanema sp. JU1783]
MTSLKDKFQAAVEIVQNLPKDGAVSTTNEEKLTFYSLFKQATVGSCNIPKPGFWNLREKYKWEAWSSLDDLSADDAMTRYVMKLQIKIEEVIRDYDEQWMFPWAQELKERLTPLFYKIGVPMVVESVGAVKENRMSRGENNSWLDVVDIASQSSIVSDSEYIDAVEEDVETRSRSSSYEIRDNVKARSKSVSSVPIEEHLMIIAERVDMLAKLFEAKSNHLVEILKKAYLYYEEEYNEKKNY